MENATATDKPQPKDLSWALNLIGLLFFLGLAWWSYSKITRYETNGGYLSLPKLLMLFYDLLGKWGVVGVWLAGALYNLVRGIISLIKHK